MKKGIYIISFVILGILAQSLAHSLIEIWYVNLLLNDFDKYGFGLSWQSWTLIHNILSIVFLIAGVIIGYMQGRFWWPKLYDTQGKVRYPKPWRI